MPSCPACGKGVTASAAKCPSCGKEIAAPAPAAGGHSYDLMPEEPKKEEASPRATAFDAAISEQAAVAAKPGEIIRPKIKLRDDDDGPQTPFFTKGTAAMAIIAGLMVIGVVFKACRTEYKLEGAWRRPTMSDNTFGANRPKVENFVVKGGANYEFEVQAIDGDLLIGVVRRDPKSTANNAGLKAAPEGLTAVPKGSTQKLEGYLKPGTYSWVVVNEGAKPVKGKWRYLAALPK
jgi:hypothetical protein